MKKRSLCLLFALLVFGSSLVSISFLGTATAANGANWQSGRVIDDGVFINKDDMTASQVQTFLNQKVGTGYYGKVSGQCDTYGTASSEYGGGTRANYGAAHGNPNPFTCLKDYYEVPKTDPAAGIPASNYGGAAIPAGAESAAQIIWDAGQRYSINPKVLLVMIQKESAGPLTTDDWPFRSQYTYAMGAHCPDGPNGAQCDSNYAGFSIQIFESARLLRYYLDNMQQSWWTYTKPYQVNSVMWNTQYSTYTDGSGNTIPCGAGNVSVTDKATAALYTYTPYQPNQAALNNLYGSVPAGSGFDSKCAAYGNRNFWRIFQDWFGNIYADPYHAAYYSQSAYPQLNPGQQAAVSLEYQNLGSQPWYDDNSLSAAPAGTYPVHLATSHTLNRSSAFGPDWPGPSRPAMNFSAVYESDGVTLASNQHVAQPGQIVKFSFNILAPTFPLAPATYPEYFQPVAEGSSSGLFTDPGTYINVTINPFPSLTYAEQSAYPTISPSTSSNAYLKLKNNGNIPLYDDTSISTAPSGTHPVHLATSNPINRASNFSSDWPNTSRAAVNFSAVYESDGVTLASNQHVAQPGQIVKFSFNFTVPAGYAAGTYNEYFQPILEGTPTGVFNNQGLYYGITVPSTPAVTYTQAAKDPTLASNQPTSLTYSFTNTGNSTLLGTTQIYTSDGSDFKAPSWVSSNVIGNLGADLAPGQTTSFTVPIIAPTVQSSVHKRITLSLVYYNTASPIASSTITSSPLINPATYQASYSGQSPYPTVTYNQALPVSILYKNTGNQVWYDDTSIATASWPNAYPIHLATSHSLNRQSGFSASSWANTTRAAVNFSAVYESDGVTLASNQHVAQPGQIVKFSFNITPATSVPESVYNEYFQPVAEGTSTGAFNDPGTYLRISLVGNIYKDSFFSQSTYPTVSPGAKAPVFFALTNAGNTPLYDDTSISTAPSGTHPVHLATSNPINRASNFSSDWPNTSRAAVNFSAVYESDGVTLASNQHVAQPGQIVKFSFNFTVPAGYAAGTYNEYFQPILEGTPTGVFNNIGTEQTVTVR